MSEIQSEVSSKGQNFTQPDLTPLSNFNFTISVNLNVDLELKQALQQIALALQKISVFEEENKIVTEVPEKIEGTLEG